MDTVDIVCESPVPDPSGLPVALCPNCAAPLQVGDAGNDIWVLACPKCRTVYCRV